MGTKTNENVNGWVGGGGPDIGHRPSGVGAVAVEVLLQHGDHHLVCHLVVLHVHPPRVLVRDAILRARPGKVQMKNEAIKEGKPKTSGVSPQKKSVQHR